MTEIVQINMNTSHYVKSTDRYRLNLGEAVDFTKCKLSLVSANCYNSTFNVKSAYDNNRIGIKWINGTIYSFTIPDGTYSLADLNGLLESLMYENGLYVTITATGKPNYFFKIQENPVSYACHVIISYVPNSLESTELGYEKPDNINWNFPSISQTPQLLLYTSGMQEFLGFTSLIYPSQPVQNDNYEVLSEVAPKLTKVFNYHVNINIINNKLGLVGSNNLFFMIPVKKAIGELIEFSPNFKLGLQCVGKFDFIEIWLTDEYYNRLEYRDKDLSCTMILEFEK